MARKRIVISSAGGIAAGSPFVVNQGLVISQASPAVAMSARFGQLVDAGRSFIAPDDSGAVNSFVLGSGSRVLATSTRSIAIGLNVLSSGGAASIEQILIGSTIDAGATNTNAANVIAIGHNITLNSAGIQTIAESVTVGNNIVYSGANGSNVAIGIGARISGGSAVAIGTSADAAAQSTSIGRLAGNLTGTQAVCIGDSADAAANAVAIGGAGASAGAQGVAIGAGSLAGADSTVLGRAAGTGAFTAGIIIGEGSNASFNNELVIGGSVNFPVNTMSIGPLFTDGAYIGLTWQQCHSVFGTTTNAVAPNFVMKGGTNNGNAAGGEIRFNTATILASGGTRQVTVQRFAIIPSTGAAGAAIIQFSNYTDGAAAQAGTLLNAPVAGNPTAWIPIKDGTGAVRHIPAW